MKTRSPLSNGLFLLAALIAAIRATAAPAETTSASFDELAGKALQAMTRRANELHVKGVAVVAYAPGDAIGSWSSKMAVAGSMVKAPAEGKSGDNLLAIAYAKAAEMAATLQDSGHGGRPNMTGEFGWQGGVIRKTKTGYLIAAFSGGPSETDVALSRLALDILAGAQ